MTLREYIGMLALLTTGVVFQYLISFRRYDKETYKELSIEIHAKKMWQNAYEAWVDWQDWIDDLLPEVDSDAVIDTFHDDIDDYDNEDETIVKINYQGSENNSLHGYFTDSKRVRRRTQKISYKVGDIVHHVNLGLRCVVVGWDKRCKAPESWLQKMYGEKAEFMKQQVHYLSMCETGDLSQEEFHYFAQLDLVKPDQVIPLKIQHIGAFFKNFDGRKYTLKRWVRKIYPEDG